MATESEPRLFNREEVRNLERRQHDILTDELEREQYDLVHARAVLMHLADPKRAVKKMATALRPGGWLLLEEFDAISYMGSLLCAAWGRRALDGDVA